MELNSEKSIKSSLSDDDEFEECEVLQSTADSYDIKEKIKAANEQLFDDYDPEIDFRERKVTFNDAVEYEPCYSSDDGFSQSPYTLVSEEIENMEGLAFYQTIEEDLIEDIQEMKLNEEEEEVESVITCQEIQEEVANEDEIEEIVTFEDGEELNENEETEHEEITNEYIEEISEDTKTGENVIEIIQDSELIDETDLEISVIHCEEETPKFKLPKQKRKEEYTTVNCRLHCLEKKELDFINKSVTIQNFHIPSELALKLKQKSCCTYKKIPKLPTYNGLKSEYGLSELQLERRRIKTEKKFVKRQEKLVRIREEKIQRDIFNEEVFSDWLKSVGARNKKKSKNNYLTYEERRPKSSYESRKSFRNKKIRPITCSNIKCNSIVLYPGVVMKTFI